MKNNVKMRKSLKAGVTTNQIALLMPHIKIAKRETSGNVSIAIDTVISPKIVGPTRRTTTLETTLETTTLVTTLTTIRTIGNTHLAAHAKRPTTLRNNVTLRRSTNKLKLQLWRKLEQP